MGRLTYDDRAKLPTSSFALPGARSFPIENPDHARNALSRVAQYGTPAEKTQVETAVHKKFPAIGKKLTAGKAKKPMAPKKAPSDFDGDE